MSAIEVKVTVEFGENARELLGSIQVVATKILERLRAESPPPVSTFWSPDDARKIFEMGALSQAAAVPPEPAPEPVRGEDAAGAASAVRVFTPERIRLMTTMRAMEHHWPEILIEFNKLPGKPCKSVDSLRMYFRDLKKAGTLPRVSVEPPADKMAPRAIPKEISARTIPPGSVNGVWTDERVLLMTMMRVSRTGWEEIAEAVNALPGPKCSGGNAVVKSYFKLKAAGKLPAVSVTVAPAAKVEPAPAVTPAPAGANPPPVVPPRVVAPPVVRPRETPVHLAGVGEKIVAPLANVLQWAAERGLCNGGSKLDMPMVNKKRRDLGLPEFELSGGAHA